jgi:hypothetical protein
VFQEDEEVPKTALNLSIQNTSTKKREKPKIRQFNETTQDRI